MAERDLAPGADGQAVADGGSQDTDRTAPDERAVPTDTLSRQAVGAGGGNAVGALTDRSPIRVVRQNGAGEHTAALRQELAAKAAATDELREALDELRQVLDVENPPPTPGTDRRRLRYLLLGGAGVAAVGILAVLLTGHDGTAIVASSTPSPSGSAAGAASHPASASPTSAGASAATTSSAAPGPATDVVRPLPWPGGAVIVPAGQTTTGPGASVPGTDVQVAVDPDGAHLDVVERYLLDASSSDPLVLIAPSLPALGAMPSVTDLQVQLDGHVVSAESDGSGSNSWSVPAPSGGYSRAVLRYRVANGVMRETPAPAGRAAGVVTPLTAALSQAHKHDVIVRTLDQHVIGVSCPGALNGGAVCGTRTPGGWSAELPDAVTPVVDLQINL